MTRSQSAAIVLWMLMLLLSRFTAATETDAVENLRRCLAGAPLLNVVGMRAGY